MHTVLIIKLTIHRLKILISKLKYRIDQM